MPKGVYARQPRPTHLYPSALAGRVAELYAAGATQAEIGLTIGCSQKVVFTIMRNHGIKARVAAKRDQFGEANQMWKGDEAGYQALHIRLYKRFGKPDHCSVCGTREAPAFDYANLTGNYADISDYAPMCRSCHHKFDGRAANLKRKEGCHAEA